MVSLNVEHIGFRQVECFSSLMGYEEVYRPVRKAFAFLVLLLASLVGGSQINFSSADEGLKSEADKIRLKWERQKSELKTCDLSYRWLRILRPSSKSTSEGSSYSQTPTHEEYSKAFNSFVAENGWSASDYEEFFRRFCGGDRDGDHIFMGLRHIWVDGYFETDGISINDGHAESKAWKSSVRNVRTPDRDLDLRIHPGRSFPVQASVRKGGTSRLWVPDLDFFSWAPDLFLGVVQSPNVETSEVSFLGIPCVRFTTAIAKVDFDRETRHPIHLRCDFSDQVIEVWNFGFTSGRYPGAVTIPSASFQVTSFLKDSEMRVSPGPRLCYVIKEAKINEPVDAQSFSLALPARAVVQTPENNVGLSDAPVDASTFADSVDVEQRPIPIISNARQSWQLYALVISGLVLFSLLFIFLRK
jgi:hypothetical protein